MSASGTVGLDLAMAVLQVHEADGAGRTVLSKALRRGQVLEVFSRLPSCVVAMKSCGDAQFRSREMGKLGDDMRRIPSACVKPFVKRQRSDMVDAEASGQPAHDALCSG